MRLKGILRMVGLGLCLVLPAAAQSEPGRDFYFGHISLADVRNDGKDVLIIREGAARGEPALLNAPVGPGDIVRTSDARRAEIQFDNGTLLRLDYDSELKVETILAPSLSSLENISNLVLTKGRAYVMYTEYDRRELFQILTPDAALKLKNHTVAEVSIDADGTSDFRVSSGRADVLFGPSEKRAQGEKVRSGERALVSADGGFRRVEFGSASEFEGWNKTLNENFRKAHEGLTPLPKPVQKMSKAVFYFAQNYSNLYGEWLWDSYLGYVWRPFVNDLRYSWGRWSPYYCGEWTRTDGRLFWIPREPWGWVPFHLGIWQWDAKRGWLWIPGSAFAPAWVVWDFYAGQRRWRPWTLWDWYFGMDADMDWWMFMDTWYWGWPGWSTWWTYQYSPWPGEGPSGGRRTLTKITKDQLKGKRPEILSLMPKEMKGIYKNLVAAFKRGAPDLAESFVRTPREGVVLRPDAVPGLIDLRTRPEPSRLPLDRDARQTVIREAGLSAALQQKAGPRGTEARASFRFRDWNPDVKVALRRGVSIRYDSRSNQVLCPQLGIASGGIDRFLRGSGTFATFGPGSNGSYAAGSPSYSRGSSGSVPVSSSSGSSHTSGGGTKKD
jgi:hypothetical protein